MDATLRALVDFVESVDPRSLPEETTRQAVRHVVDTVGCGAGGFASEPARIAREVTRGAGGALVASAYGEHTPTLVDAVAFSNATANRYLDFNDFGSSGHPSDMIPAVLAMAEAVGASGADVVAGVCIAYAIATDLAEAVPPTGGWDQGVFSSLGVAGALAKIMRLSPQQTAHALSLAIVPSLPLKVTRYGELSAWKAAAVPHASMTATFAARLARAGMEGPAAPFEGRFGMFEQAWEAFELPLGDRALRAIERSSLKRFGACYWGQVAIDIATGLREQVDPATVTAIDVATSEAAHRTIGGGVGDAAEKWRPATRETADHSMPFLVASALRDGRIDDATFADDRLTDPGLHRLMDVTRVVADEALSARATRDRCPTRIRVTLADGSVLEREQDVPHGHPERPMSDADVTAKFEGLIGRVLPAAAAADLAHRLWDLPRLGDLRDVGTLFRRFRT